MTLMGMKRTQIVQRVHSPRYRILECMDLETLHGMRSLMRLLMIMEPLLMTGLRLTTIPPPTCGPVWIIKGMITTLDTSTIWMRH